MGNIARRHTFILEQLKKDGYVKVHDLSQQLNVSEVTIRKDLKQLESKKLLYRNHGSASSLSMIISDKHIDIKEKYRRKRKDGLPKQPVYYWSLKIKSLSHPGLHSLLLLKK